MNKAEIKQVILEEIKSVLNEIEAGEGIDPAEKEVIDTLTQDYEGDIDDEDIAALQKDFRDESDDMFGRPSFVEEDESLEEMARTSNVFKLKDNHTYDEVLRFMERVNTLLKTYKTPGQKRPKKRFSAEDMKKVATALTSSSGFTSKDIRLAVDAYNSPAQANKFIKALEMKGYIELTSQLKKAMKPERDPNAPETRGRKAKSAEFDISDDPMTDLDALGLGGSIDLSDPLAENNNTMSELEKYIKQVIKEAKNPLAGKMKEIENQGRIAALETKLAAIAEMIEETQNRLTRIDEDSEFNEMMDRKKVRDVRKQLKELERAKAKLEKEMAKAEGKGMKSYKKKEVMDEDIPVAEANTKDIFGVDIDNLEEENLNESTLRMQKLAGLITESETKRNLITEGLFDFFKKPAPAEPPAEKPKATITTPPPYILIIGVDKKAKGTDTVLKGKEFANMITKTKEFTLLDGLAKLSQSGFKILPIGSSIGKLIFDSQKKSPSDRNLDKLGISEFKKLALAKGAAFVDFDDNGTASTLAKMPVNNISPADLEKTGALDILRKKYNVMTDKDARKAQRAADAKDYEDAMMGNYDPRA